MSGQQNPVLDHGLFYVERGVYINALQPGSKALIKPGKILDHAVCDAAGAEELFADHPERNLGIVPGPASNLWTLDVDVKNGQRGREALAALEKRFGPLDKTLCEVTPSGGLHYHYRLDGADVPTGKIVVDGIAGIELMGRPYNVCVAPSTVEGKPYTLVERCEIKALSKAKLEFLLSCRVEKDEIGRPKTERNNGLFREACSMRRHRMPEAEAWPRLLQLNETLCTPPLEEWEVRKAFDSAWRYDPGYERSELGNAQRLVDRFGRKLHYVVEQRSFYTWNDKRWVEDAESLLSAAMMKHAIGDIRDDAGKETQKDEAKKTFAWALASQATFRIEASLRSARSEPGIPISITRFDADPMLLGVQNGTLDLRDCSFRKSQREDYITMAAGCDFAAGATYPTWDAFLDVATCGDADYRSYLQSAVGYTLTGDTGERCLFFTYGSGDNGKSVFLAVLKDLLGSYGKNIRSETIMARVHRSKGGASEDEARLAGARLATANETEAGMRFDEALIKDLTGGDDLVTARHLFRASFDFKPQVKIWIRGNYKPSFSGDDVATANRLRLLPFLAVIPKAEQDKALSKKLRAELPGILNWALAGCLAWQRDGLITPAVVRDATQEYVDDEDMLGNFLADQCNKGSTPEHIVSNGELYLAFTSWCQSNGRVPYSLKRLLNQLEQKGFRKDRNHAKGRVIVGLRLGRGQVYDLTHGQPPKEGQP